MVLDQPEDMFPPATVNEFLREFDRHLCKKEHVCIALAVGDTEGGAQ